MNHLSWLQGLVLVLIALVPDSSSFTTTITTATARTNALIIRASFQFPPTRRVSSVSMTTPNIIATTMDTIHAFSKSSLSNQLTHTAIATPPLAYFLALMAAGCGIPVSEDGICLFAGAVWSTLTNDERIQRFVALYLGVVGSDALTFWIGRALRMGVLQPFTNRLKLNQENDMQDAVADKSIGNRKRDRMMRVMEQSGDWIGFVIRFSVGTRGPLMLLSGFTNKVPFVKFILGASLGALITLPLQLYGGHVLGHEHPGAIVGLLAGISTFAAVTAISVFVATGGALLVTQVKQMRQQAKKTTA